MSSNNNSTVTHCEMNLQLHQLNYKTLNNEILIFIDQARITELS